MTAIHPTTTPSDLLRIADLTGAQLRALLDLADEMRNGPTWWTTAHDGRAIACLFDERSTRTRVSFDVAAQRLGLQPIMVRPDEQLGRGEPLADTARVLSSSTAAIVVGTFAQATVEALAAAASVPVINAMTYDHHPSRALADLLTLRRHYGYLDGLRLAYVGDANNVAHSLMEAGALAGMHVAIATPGGNEPDHDVTMRALALATAHGGSLQLGHDPHAAIADADAVHTDVRVSMGSAAPEAVLLHIDGPRSIVSEQAANRLPTEQAILHTLVGSAHPAGE